MLINKNINYYMLCKWKMVDGPHKEGGLLRLIGMEIVWQEGYIDVFCP